MKKKNKKQKSKLHTFNSKEVCDAIYKSLCHANKKLNIGYDAYLDTTPKP